MRLAFVYDRINKIGGAERVLKALHEIWPQAPFYTAVYSPKRAEFAKGWQIKTSFLQRIPFARSHHEIFPWLTPIAFESFSFDDFDLVISITSAEAKGIITKPDTLHVCYCLTPTRYLWSHSKQYLQAAPKWQRQFIKLLTPKLRSWDKVAAQRPDSYLAISKNVNQRIKKYYHRDSDVIYPSVDTNFFRPITDHQSLITSHFLVVSRLVSYKRIDLAVKACTKLKLPLVVVGVGNQLSKLKKIAGSTIKFVGKVTDKELLKLYQSCRALIFPGEEDFGISPLEAQSTGKPVIAYRAGGAKETIIEGKTGEFFDTLSVSSLFSKLESFDSTRYNPKLIAHHAANFAEGKFKTKFKSTIETLWQKHQQSL